MGQKVNPLGIRLGITRDWVSKWYASKRQFPVLIYTDFQVRTFLKKKLADASVSRILIERAAKKVNITIQTARPGIVIGKKGEDIERDSQARTRCAAGRRRHCAADRKACHVPSRDEARGDEHHAQRFAGHQGAHVGPIERF
jgi:ribosomal protein S3